MFIKISEYINIKKINNINLNFIKKFLNPYSDAFNIN